MHLARRILQIVFLGFLCTMVSCHGLISDESIDATSQPDTETTQQYDNNNNYEKASTLEGFIRLLGDDPRQVLSSMYGQNDGGKNIAKPDICSPRPISVKLKYNLDRTGIIHYPVCTLVDRCGGCSTPGVKCVPTKTEWLNLTAIAAEYSNTAIAWTYKEVYVAIRRHLSCKIQCSLNDEKCGPKKIFKAADCLCYCREHLKCESPFFLDPETCNCTCGPINCCPDGPAKPCHLVLNNKTCQCDLKPQMYSNASGSIPSSQQVVTSALSTPPAAAPNTTSTTSSANDPCANYKCPPRTVKYVNNGRGCACRTQNVIPQN
ncbi:uncharacterized protein LOC131950050 isoform X2 [Physella acuta]|uniref:uncharacterized protein LOC131950050 isoform X2 n=1 Tax=Physella acuta TaxID=109671 RepID=UPI0027DD1F71|nr:uncharacterized protein LOC131950050 isoform X2 [Physella acuta]